MTTTRAKEQGRLLTVGLGGHTVYFPSRKEGKLSYGPSTLSGYITDGDRAATDSSADLEIGCPVIDKTGVLAEKPGLAIKGPMVNVDLEAGQVDECPQPNELFAAAVSSNAFGGLLALQEAHKASGRTEPGPLDSIAVADYVAWWRRQGARIGVWDGERVMWE